MYTDFLQTWINFEMATSNCILALLLLLTAPAAYSTLCSQTENSYLWRVVVSPPVYIFGTLHLPYTSMWNDIPINVKNSFSESQQLFLELQLSNEETSIGLQNCQILSNDREIDEVLSPDLITRIENYLDKIHRLFPIWLNEGSQSNLIRGGLSFSDQLFASVTHNWRQKKPIWVLALISSLTEDNIIQRKTPVLDFFLDNAARNLGKELGALETVNDHCQPLNRLEDDQVETILRIALDYLESLPNGPSSVLERDVNTYRCGDLRQLIESQPFLPLPPLSTLTNISNITNEDRLVLTEVETMLYNRLSTRRNRRMTRAIDSILKEERNHTTFIAIGAAHLIGSKSIIDRLEKKDYIIHHLDATEIIDGPGLPDNIVALGDPGSVAHPILDIEEVPTWSHSLHLETLEDDELGQLIREYIPGSSNTERKRSVVTMAENRYEGDYGFYDDHHDYHSDTSSSWTTAASQSKIISIFALFMSIICISTLH